MTQHLSKKRYLFLVDLYKNSFGETGESLSPSESEELSKYKWLLKLQLTYNDRFKYLTLLEDYVTGKIDLDPFYTEFYTVYIKNKHTYSNMEYDVEQLSNFPIEFELESKMTEFNDLIYDIWTEDEVVYSEEMNKTVWDSDYQPNIESTINLLYEMYREMKQCLE